MWPSTSHRSARRAALWTDSLDDIVAVGGRLCDYAPLRGTGMVTDVGRACAAGPWTAHGGGDDVNVKVRLVTCVCVEATVVAVLQVTLVANQRRGQSEARVRGRAIVGTRASGHASMWRWCKCLGRTLGQSCAHVAAKRKLMLQRRIHQCRCRRLYCCRCLYCWRCWCADPRRVDRGW